MDEEKTNQDQLLGHYVAQRLLFSHLGEQLDQLYSTSFALLTSHQKFHSIGKLLLEQIQNSPFPCFLLPALVDAIGQINQRELLDEAYQLTQFEFWLNHFAQIDEKEQLLVRSKIMGKQLPREEYQRLFPLGQGVKQNGSHFVAAHLSPDLDTTICSFWGFCDAFAAKVGRGLHYWALPGGPPKSPMLHIFYDHFGEGFFPVVARMATSLTLQALDLMTTEQMAKKKGETCISAISHGANERAILLVDKEGHYQGDWRSSDVELVRQVIVLFKSCLHWFENTLHIRLISLFAAPHLSASALDSFLGSFLTLPLADWEPVEEFTLRQKRELDQFLRLVIELPEGLHCHYEQLAAGLDRLELYDLSLFAEQWRALAHCSLFDERGQLIDNRTAILNVIQRIIIQLDVAIHHVRNFVERLDMAMKIKSRLISPSQPPYVTPYTELADVEMKMQQLDYLTVAIEDKRGPLFPIGIIWRDELRKRPLGTVSLRDFSNLDEVRMAPYLSIISIIDHHRSAFSSPSTPLVIIGDVQSSNTLAAEIAMELNDKFSLGGLSPATIQRQRELLENNCHSYRSLRLLRKLLHKEQLHGQWPGGRVDPKRELVEYFTFLYAILDDTDLLTKVTTRDVECVAQLLNRLKTLLCQSEMEVVDFDELPRDEKFAQKAARRLLAHPDLFSIYSKVYKLREEQIEEQINQAHHRENSSLFEDVKEQNGCCRIGQTKLFVSNIPSFLHHRPELIALWLEKAEEWIVDHREVDFHLHMISTVTSAEETYRNEESSYSHQDELWLWGPPTQQAYAHLGSFLLAWQAAPELQGARLDLNASYSEDEGEVAELFRRNFPLARPAQAMRQGDELLWAVLRFKAGGLNSRKSMISPYLPKLVI